MNLTEWCSELAQAEASFKAAEARLIESKAEYARASEALRKVKAALQPETHRAPTREEDDRDNYERRVEAKRLETERDAGVLKRALAAAAQASTGIRCIREGDSHQPPTTRPTARDSGSQDLPQAASGDPKLETQAPGPGSRDADPLA